MIPRGCHPNRLSNAAAWVNCECRDSADRAGTRGVAPDWHLSLPRVRDRAHRNHGRKPRFLLLEIGGVETALSGLRDR